MGGREVSKESTLKRLVHAPRDAGRALRRLGTDLPFQIGKPRKGIASFIKAEFGAPAEERFHNHVAFYGIERDSFSKLGGKRKFIKKSVERINHLCNIVGSAESLKASIIIPTYNNVALTLSTIESVLTARTKYSFEIIIADDSSDTKLESIASSLNKPIRYIRNPGQKGFLPNSNYSAKYACGEILVFLNNDVVVLDNWLTELVGTIENDREVGFVGSRLVYPDGVLQEAGGIIFEDASGWNYGRGGDPMNPDYTFSRDVDYASGASIAIPADLWCDLDGFDNVFSPAYYEDTDLAFRIRKLGKKVKYQALSVAIHLEGMSHGTSTASGIKKHQEINRHVFYDRWRDVLSSYGSPDPKKLPIQRTKRESVLIIDHEIPRPDRISGSQDCVEYIRLLDELGYFVSFIPHDMIDREPYSADLRRSGVRVCSGPFYDNVVEALKAWGDQFSFIFIFRYSIAHFYLDAVREICPSAKIIFQTVDLHYLRAGREGKLHGDAALIERAKKIEKIERSVMERSDATIVLSEQEFGLIKGSISEDKLWHIPIFRSEPKVAPPPFSARRNIAFIGGFRHTPNVDGLRWFLEEVWPKVIARGLTADLIVIGAEAPPEILALASSNVHFLGQIPDLLPIFGSVKLSVAPIRYGAGLKGKVVTSLGLGVPVVGTSTAFEGSGLRNGHDVTEANDPDEFAQAIVDLYGDEKRWQKLSAEGLASWRLLFSREKGKDALVRLLETVKHRQA